MSFNDLPAEHQKMILELNKRIEIMESRLVRLQDRVVRVDGPLISQLAKEIGHINLN